MSVPYVHRRRIQWGDTDAAQIVYTVRFFDFIMEAIEGWFWAVVGVDWYRLNLDMNLGTPFVHVDMDFKAPLTPRHDLETIVRVERLGSKSLTFQISGRRSDGTSSFEARFICCMVDNRTMTPVAVPDEMRDRIRGYMDACDDATQANSAGTLAFE